jgi:hypothetical protein
VLDPSEYKKTVKLLKSSKLDKALEGCEKSLDATFVAKSGAIGPLMNLMIGHNKKVAEAAFPALEAVANFLDPVRGAGHFGAAGAGGDAFTANGVQLISKKSGGWKGAERIAQILRNANTTSSMADDDTAATDPRMKGAEVTDEALRCLASVVESFVAHGIGASEEGVYRQKIRDLGGALPIAVVALKRGDVSASTKRYGVRLVHRLVTYLTEESMCLEGDVEPITAAAGGGGEAETAADGAEPPPAPDVEAMRSMEPPSPAAAAAAAQAVAEAAEAKAKETAATARANAVRLVSSIVPLLVELLREAVFESRNDDVAPVRLAQPQRHISPELELINLVVRELNVGRESPTWSEKGALKCVTAGALPVLGRTIECLHDELAKISQEEDGGASAAQRGVLLSNLKIATECACRLMKCGVSSDSMDVKMLHAAVRDDDVSAAEGNAAVAEAGGEAGDEAAAAAEGDAADNGGESGDPLKGDVSKLEFGAASKSVFSIAAASCAQGTGKALATLLSGSFEDDLSFTVTASLMQTAFQVSTLNGMLGVGFSELLRPLICAQGCLPSLHAAVAQSLAVANDAEKLMHALIVHHEGDLQGQADARVLGGGAVGAWLNVADVIAAFQAAKGSSLGSDGGEGDDAGAAAALAPDFTVQTRLLRLLAKLSKNQANAATIGDAMDFVPIAQEYIAMRRLKQAPVPDQAAEEPAPVEAPPEEPPEDAKGKKKKKKKKEKKKKKKKKAKVDIEQVRSDWADAAFAASNRGFQDRGSFSGAEVAILAARLIRNLSAFHVQTCLRLGGNDAASEEAGGQEGGNVGSAIVADLVKMCDQSDVSGVEGEEAPRSASHRVYDPCLAIWAAELNGMSRAYAVAAAAHMEIPTDIDLVPKFLTDTDSLQSGIFAVGVEGEAGEYCQVVESHPEIYLQAEAMESLSSFAQASSLWYASAMEMAIASAKAKAFEAAQSEVDAEAIELEDVLANAADVEEALAGQIETTAGAALSALVTSTCASFLFAAVNRDETSVSRGRCTTAAVARDLVLRHALGALAGLCAAPGGREAIMASLGWESKEDAVTFNPESSKEAFPFHFAVVSGVSSLLFAQKAAETADAVTLLQQQSALRCLRTLCKDHHVEPQSQSLNADTIAQCAIA